MKIRTGFVTNSSSTSYCAIRVSSSKLAEILKKYKKLFKEPNYGRKGNPVTDDGFDFDDQRSWWHYSGPTDRAEMASNFVDFIRCYFVDALEWGGDAESLPEITKLIEELEENSEEINASISSFEVEVTDFNHGENCGASWEDFSDDYIKNYMEEHMRDQMELEEGEELTLTDDIRYEFERLIQVDSTELTRTWSYDGKEIKSTRHMSLG